MSLTTGTRLGPYEVLTLHGSGGMGEVWKARDTRLDRIVALKRLTGRYSDRFEKEARAIAALNHPHICQIYDVGPDYLILEFIEGQTLADRLRSVVGVGLPPQEALHIARQIAEGLEEAHRARILHRDLKPANVMITTKGIAKLLDFGLARFATGAGDVTLTADGAVVGTPAYMSPEQVESKPLDERSDIFSFGVVLYEMLSGRRAFAGSTTVEVMNAILRETPPRLQTSPSLDRLVRQCMAKHPASRFQTVTDIRTALEPTAGEPLSTLGAVDRQPSIAVLPFANMSADKENEYFSDGLAEEIINVLANMPGLKVTGRTSSFFFRGKDVPFEEIGQKLNVDHILEGSVRRSGNRIRVTAQLIKVADGFHLWSERYDREMTDIFALQDEVTHAIATALQVKLSPESASPRRSPPDLRAYDAYLKALDQWSRPTPESLVRIKEYLDKAIAFDPEFAQAYTALGMYYSMVASIGTTPTREAIALARAAVHEALRIDPSLAEPRALLGVWAGGYDEYDWRGAEQHWRLALAREPVSYHVRLWYGNHYLLPIGRYQEALDAMTKGVEGDPLNLLYRHHFADGLRNAGRFEEAYVELHRILDLEPSFQWAVGTLGILCAQQGKWDEALALSEKAYALGPSPLAAGQLSALLLRNGESHRAETLLEPLRSGTAWGASTGMALFHALCDEFDQAADWVERAFDDRYPRLIPIFRPLLRSTPRWPTLARMMNLPGSSTSARTQ